MKLLPGLAPMAARYDGFVVDLWGVVHNGVTPYPGALDCLAALRARSKRIVLLSNAPRRAASAAEGLRSLGISDSYYDAIVTAGEATHAVLRLRPDRWFEQLGDRVYHLGPPRDRDVFAGAGLIEVSDPAGASFVLNTGPDDERSPTDLAAFDDVLAACREADLPMLCANPDLTVIRGGVEIYCAGALAERYAGLGGMVRSIGKPDPAIYRDVLHLLDLPRDRVVAIGDSLRTDIAGAARAEIDSVWVLGGIHAFRDAAMAKAAAAHWGLSPTAAIFRLEW